MDVTQTTNSSYIEEGGRVTITTQADSPKVGIEPTDTGPCVEIETKKSSSAETVNKVRRGRSRTNNYNCSHCSKTFSNSSNVKRHERAHTGEKPFQCSECKRRFTYKSSLQSHIMASHRDYKPFECSICEIFFSDKSNLRRHKLSHVGEKRFECYVCNRKFAVRHNMETHLKKVHFGLPNHMCPVCCKGFEKKYDLEFHTQHFCRGPYYQCTSCGMVYDTKCHLQQHFLSQMHIDLSQK